MVTEYIPVISAQNDWGDKFPRKVPKWKKLSFMSLWKMEGLLDRDSALNLIVIGDSQFEMKAGKYFKKRSNLKKRCFLKLIKLKEDPSAEQLER